MGAGKLQARIVQAQGGRHQTPSGDCESLFRLCRQGPPAGDESSRWLPLPAFESSLKGFTAGKPAARRFPQGLIAYRAGSRLPGYGGCLAAAHENCCLLRQPALQRQAGSRNWRAILVSSGSPWRSCWPSRRATLIAQADRCLLLCQLLVAQLLQLMPAVGYAGAADGQGGRAAQNAVGRSGKSTGSQKPLQSRSHGVAPGIRFEPAPA